MAIGERQRWSRSTRDSRGLDILFRLLSPRTVTVQPLYLGRSLGRARSRGWVRSAIQRLSTHASFCSPSIRPGKEVGRWLAHSFLHLSYIFILFSSALQSIQSLSKQQEHHQRLDGQYFAHSLEAKTIVLSNRLYYPSCLSSPLHCTDRCRDIKVS
ncbi:uncharacterized protein UHOD_20816 [Ustilago sp. UG-2017b]|nr:uncharacterized protein UHOD_20816 [Ustilago sp. UG-2017b]